MGYNYFIRNFCLDLNIFLLGIFFKSIGNLFHSLIALNKNCFVLLIFILLAVEYFHSQEISYIKSGSATEYVSYSESGYPIHCPLKFYEIEQEYYLVQ